MRLAQLRIKNFRGIQEGTVQFNAHTVLVGPNNCGKTTVIEALALLFGRDRMVRPLTEHDFFGSDPQPQDRIKLVATIVGFEGNDPAQHLDWFRDDRGVVKWWNPATRAVEPERANEDWQLACQVAFAARFDRPSLEVETIRYFHDDDTVADVFGDEETYAPLPSRLIRDIGFFLVPASRTWDRTVTFGSELFRRVVAAGAGQPFESVLDERDRLRDPSSKLEEDAHLAPIVTRLNDELRGFFRMSPTLHLRVTATDSDSLLEAVVSHYAHGTAASPLPARRHGSGLLSLQHLLLLFEFGRLRAEAHEGFWMALEEPELHVPPALQRRLVHRIQALSSQTFVSTHSPMVAALADPAGVAVLRNENGVLTSVPLLATSLASQANSVRKLFQVNRVETISALMHEFVLVPEGRTDFEWLGMLVRAVDLHQGWGSDEVSRFDSFVGVIPTQDGSTVLTVAALEPLHPRIVAMVDGDGAGIGYAQELVAAGAPNSGTIIRWPDGQMFEDIIGWIIEADATSCLGAIDIHPASTTVADLVGRLKSKDRQNGGLKTDTSSYEAIAGAIAENEHCRSRARELLNAMAGVVRGVPNARFAADPVVQSALVFQP
jgi:predicted ATPase